MAEERIAPIDAQRTKKELGNRHVRVSPVFELIFPAHPRTGDELIHHVLVGATGVLARGQYAYAKNLFETALKIPTNNKWLYHAMAALYLGKLAQDAERRPALAWLERALRLNPLLPDALEFALAQDRALVARIIREATGLKDLEPEPFIAVAKSGNWTELLPFRDNDDTFRGKRVLDIGARTGFHALSFFAMGAAFYSGMEITQKAFRQSYLKNYFTIEHERMEVGFTMDEFGKRHPDRIKLQRDSKKHLKESGTYDFITMFSVSEHLKRPHETFAQMKGWLARDGRAFISHHNFFAWNGHHERPKSTGELEKMLAGELDAEAEEQRVSGGTGATNERWKTAAGGLHVADWNHFDEDVTHTRLNKLPMAEMRRQLEKHFKVARWEPVYTTTKKGMERMSGEILDAHVGRVAGEERVGIEDLLTQNVLIELRRKTLF